jgi:hypothetical protein
MMFDEDESPPVEVQQSDDPFDDDLMRELERFHGKSRSSRAVSRAHAGDKSLAVLTVRR